MDVDAFMQMTQPDYPTKQRKHKTMTGMHKKSILRNLNDVMNCLADSIEDDAVSEAVTEGSIVTGGCIASMLLGEDVNDYDIYFREYDTVNMVAEYYAEKKNLTVIADGTRVKYDILHKQYTSTGFGSVIGVSPNAITLMGEDGCPIQLMLRFYGDPKTIHESFDYMHATNYYVSHPSELVLNTDAMACLMSKTLLYRGSKFPIASLVRSRKFIQRGWKINAAQYLKMAVQIGALNLSDSDVLEDQLAGVDVAYFGDFLNHYRNHADEGDIVASVMEDIDDYFERGEEE